MPIDLTVLGSSGSHAGPGRVCSGYLVEHDGARMLVDCGNGSTANLQLTTPFEALDAVVVTHRHVDHCIDLIGMFYALRFHEHGHRTLPLYAARDVHGLLTGLLSDDSALAFDEVFHHVPIEPGDHFEVAGIEVDCFRAEHPVPTVSLRIAAGATVLTYSSDTARCPDLVAAARDADLLLCEATWQGDPARWPGGLHLTATEAGDVAAAAGVDRLMLTHVLGSLDPEVSAAEARRTFGRAVEVARDRDRTTIG